MIFAQYVLAHRSRIDELMQSENKIRLVTLTTHFSSMHASGKISKLRNLAAIAVDTFSHPIIA